MKTAMAAERLTAIPNNPPPDWMRETPEISRGARHQTGSEGTISP